jgi:hypothetical protein
MADFSTPVPTYTRTELDYSKISFDEIVSDIGRIVNLRSNNLQDFFRSATGRRMAEMFAATLNVNWKYLETSFLESFLISAQNYSSIIAGSGSMGYSVRRPTSSMASFRVEVSGSIGTYSGKFTIPKFSNIDFNGLNFISLDEYTFDWDYSGRVVGPATGATIVQGDFRVRRFMADGKKKFQKFSFNDSTFSDYFGENDLLYSDPTFENRITAVTVDGVAWDIDRRTLYSITQDNTPTVKNGVFIESTNKRVLIRTGNDGNIELIFGDGIISEIPRGIVEVRYLSTKGTASNVMNSQDVAINFNGPDPITFIPASISNDNLSIYLNTSPLGGDDLESVESIRQNAPKIFASLDRYVISDDYKAGLQTLQNVKYAMAYGEDDIAPGDYRYSNVVMYTVLKNLYVSDANSTTLVPATPSQYVFSGLKTVDIVRKMQDSAGWPINDLSSQYQLSYLDNNIDDVAKYMNYVENYGKLFRLSKQDLETGSELATISGNLRKKGQLTCRNVYIPPKVHKFRMKVNVYTTPITSKTNLKTQIEQESYQYLKENTKFNFPIYTSKIIKMIEAKTGIVGAHVYFEPEDDIPHDSVYIDILTSESNSIFYNDLVPTLKNISNTIYINTNNRSLYPKFGPDFYEYTSLLNSTFCKLSSTAFDINKMNERNISDFIDQIYRETMGKIVLNPQVYGTPSNITDIINNVQFNNPSTNENLFDIFVRWAVQFRLDTNYYSAKAMVSDEGDIASFSIPHEIAQVYITGSSDITILGKTN